MTKVRTDSKFIKNVWSSNIVKEFKNISILTRDYFYVSIDTESPGFLPDINGKTSISIYYQKYHNMKPSVNKTKLIKLGISIADATGICGGTWQFNLKFSRNDKHFPKSNYFLKEVGLDFISMERNEIDHTMFVTCFKKSSLFQNPIIIWISYHGFCNYAYMYRNISEGNLPRNRKQFYDIFRAYFLSSFDIKDMRSRKRLFPKLGGLQRFSQFLRCGRISDQYNAGVDAWVISKVFFHVRGIGYSHSIPRKYCHVLYEMPYDTPSVYHVPPPLPQYRTVDVNDDEIVNPTLFALTKFLDM